MAEALVSFVIETLGKAINREYFFLSETSAQFERLQAEFVSIKAFLNTADSYRLKRPGMLAWVADVQNLAYEVDDVLSGISQRVDEETRRRANMNILLRRVYKLREPVDLHKMGVEMKTIFTRIGDVSNRRKRYGTEMGEVANSFSTSHRVELRRVYSHGENVDIVGLEEATASLVAELKKNYDERLRVVSTMSDCVLSPYVEWEAYASVGSGGLLDVEYED